MAFAPGTRIGPYEITATIGAGGMGEVYRALDPSLDRIVAIKVLPELLASDRERVARFSREAKTLASLNHANIAHIHGVVESPFALVMEFVEGEDLAQRLAHGPIPLDEAVPIAKQIADALECAHEQGIVHRDLKPANVKVRPDGTVKVLDFGLAKALSSPVESSSGSIAPMLSPTFTTPAMTQLGIILGTAAYMAPEQARGKAVDKRADIWAFGVVLFEMLSGTRAFEGSEVSDTLAFVLTREPDWKTLPADTPAPIRRLLRRCLHKDRKQRLADISDARIELDEALAPAAAESPASAPPVPMSAWRRAAVPIALIAGGLIGAAIAWRIFSPAPVAPPVTRFTITLPEGVDFTNTGRHFVGVSNDGSRVVYTAGSQLYVRRLSAFASEPVPGSAIGTPVINPVFSPDGQSIAFYSENTFRRMPVSGGTPFTLTTTVTNPLGLHWSDAGIFAGQTGVGIVRVPESGGKIEVIAKNASGESAQSPQLLPDGEMLIFTIYPATGDNRYDKGKIVAQSLRTGERKILYEGGGDGHVIPGHLLFGQGSVLYAIKFDRATMTVSGSPAPVLDGVRRTPATGASIYRVAANGTLIYVPGTAISTLTPRTLGFLDRSGKITPIATPANAFDTPRLSPDGKRIAVVVAVNDQASDIWIQDFPVKSALRRLTYGGRNRNPTWSPDGKQIAFQSNRDGDEAVYVQDADVSGTAAQLLVKSDSGFALNPTSWSIDNWISVTSFKAGVGATVEVVSLKEKKLHRFAGLPNQLTASGSFSPDGRWLAYAWSTGVGAAPVTYIEPFPRTGDGAKYEIGEGTHPVWTPDGKELIVSPRAVVFTLYNIITSPRFAFTVTSRLDRGQVLVAGPTRSFDVSHDGKQLLVLLPTSASITPTREINVVMNWVAELPK